MTELMVILVIGLLVLGPKRLPELARSLGRGLAEFRRASNDMRREFMEVADEARIDDVDAAAKKKVPSAAPSPAAPTRELPAASSAAPEEPPAPNAENSGSG